MSEPTKFGKFMKIVGIIVLGLTAIFHLIGGAGTTCAALGAENYDSMQGLVPFKWLYQIYVVLTIGIGVYGVRAVIRFARSKPGSYRYAVMILIVGALVTGAHVVTSRVLRGASMPNDGRLYMNILALIVFLLFNIPKLRAAMALDSGKNDIGSEGGLGAAFVLMGLMILTVQYWAGPTHTWGGVNYADVWHDVLFGMGWLFNLSGMALILRSVFKKQPSLAEASA